MASADSVVPYINADEMHAIGRIDGRQNYIWIPLLLYIAPQFISISGMTNRVIIFDLSRAGD
jgi:hypothetical protein